MKNFNDIKFTPELMAKIEACQSADEIVKFAKDNNIKLSLAEAEKYFKKVPMTKLSDAELDKIAGGATQKKDFTIPERNGEK